MPRFLFLAIAGLVATVGQDVQLRPHFVAGDEFTISMTRTTEERLDTVQTHSISRTIRIRVVSTGADGTILLWRPGPGELKGVPQRTDARMALATLAAADHDFQLELDGNGQYRRTANVAALAESLDRARESMRARVPAINNPDLSTLPPLSATHVASTVGRDAEVFTFFYGMSSPVGQSVDLPATFPWPGGGIPGVRRFRIVSANDDKAEATMTFTLDQNALRKSIPGADKMPIEMDLIETAHYVFDRSIGLNRAGTIDRIALNGPDRRLERWEFTLTVAPKR